VACWSTKATICLKRVKIEEKLLWRAYRNPPTLLRMVPSPTHYGLLPKIGVRYPHPKFQSLLSHGKSEAMHFKFGRYIHRVHSNKSPLKFCEKRERGRSRGLPKFSSYELQILYANSHDRSEQKSIKILGKVAMGVLRESRKFSGNSYIGRIARSSLQ